MQLKGRTSKYYQDDKMPGRKIQPWLEMEENNIRDVNVQVPNLEIQLKVKNNT